MDGMEAIVICRGGIYNLGMNGILNTIICWQVSRRFVGLQWDKTLNLHRQDQITAELTGKPARFAPAEGHQPVPEVDLPQYAVDITSPMPWSMLMLAPQSGDLNQSIPAILSQLVRLRKLEAGLRDAMAEEKLSYEELLTATEDKMRLYIMKTTSLASLDRTDLIREASCTSGLIYSTIQFRQAVPGDVALNVLKDRLIHVFNNLDIEVIEPQSLKTEAPFLLWILFSGCILCMNDAERIFFTSRIISLITLLNFKTWEEVDGLMKGYIWTDKWDNWPDWNLRYEIETSCGWKYV
jgi:hypothetical protein